MCKQLNSLVLLIQRTASLEHPSPELRLCGSQGSRGLSLIVSKADLKTVRTYIFNSVSYSLNPVKESPEPSKRSPVSYWLWWGHMTESEPITMAWARNANCFFSEL